MHKKLKRPAKSVKTKLTYQGNFKNYFANLRLLSCHTEICKPDGAFNELPFPPVQQCTYGVLSYKRTEGRQISIFNIIDYQVVFTNEDEKKPYLLWKKLNGINWLIFIWAVAKNIRCVGIKQ